MNRASRRKMQRKIAKMKWDKLGSLDSGSSKFEDGILKIRRKTRYFANKDMVREPLILFIKDKELTKISIRARSDESTRLIRKEITRQEVEEKLNIDINALEKPEDLKTIEFLQHKKGILEAFNKLYGK